MLTIISTSVQIKYELSLISPLKRERDLLSINPEMKFSVRILISRHDYQIIPSLFERRVGMSSKVNL